MKKSICILILVSGLFVRPLFSQVDSVDVLYAIADTQVVNPTLFDSDDLFEISLRFDIPYFRRKKPNDVYLDAVLTYHTGGTDSIRKNLKVRARGNMRRTYCDFPPLLLNFRTKDTVGSEFSGIDKLKVVSYCKLGHEEYILKEYLIYKLYNILTDNSYQVRLFRINYTSTSGKSKPLTQYGFAIEPTRFLEKRINALEVKLPGLSQRVIRQEAMDRCAIFNYMVGNTDWSVPNLHNVTIMSMPGSDNPSLGMIVPYDFDYSGFVNAHYAIPFETLPVKSVRDRYYMGFCRSKDVFEDALKEFQNKKEEFYKVISDFPYLSERSKKGAISYLNEFFSDFDKRNTIVSKLLMQCRIK